MNWLLVSLAVTGVIAGPVVAGVLAPGLMTQVAQQGVAVHHRHFVFNEERTFNAKGQPWTLDLYDGDLYELPVSTQVELRGAVHPAPSDADLQAAVHKLVDRYHLPVLGYDVQRNGEDLTIKATFPAGVLAGLSPQYQQFLAKYEAN